MTTRCCGSHQVSSQQPPPHTSSKRRAGTQQQKLAEIKCLSKFRRKVNPGHLYIFNITRFHQKGRYFVTAQYSRHACRCAVRCHLSVSSQHCPWKITLTLSCQSWIFNQHGQVQAGAGSLLLVRIIMWKRGRRGNQI